MVVWWDDSMIVPLSDGPVFIFIDWKWFDETVGSWVGLRSNCSLKNYFENRILFLTQFLAKFHSELFQIYIFLQLRKKNITLYQQLRPSQQTTVSPNYSQSIKVNIGPSSSGGTIIPSSHCPTVLYWRLSDFATESFRPSFLKINKITVLKFLAILNVTYKIRWSLNKKRYVLDKSQLF